MSLIDDRYVCDECGGYRTGFKTTLSSACKCPDYHPVDPGRHQIGAPRRPILTISTATRWRP